MKNTRQTFWNHYALRRLRQKQGCDSGSWLTALLWAWRWITVLVLLALSACGDNLCGCPFGMVCQPAPRQEGFVCVAPPQASK